MVNFIEKSQLIRYTSNCKILSAASIIMQKRLEPMSEISHNL